MNREKFYGANLVAGSKSLWLMST